MIANNSNPVVRCNLLGDYQRLDFRASKTLTERIQEKMRLQSAEESRVIVTVKQAKRDDRKQVKDEHGKLIENKMYGKIIYETVESIDVYEATGEQVFQAVEAGLKAATAKK